MFLDISKAFDRIWHQGPLFKLEQNGITGKLLPLIGHFLDNRLQRVILNGQCSDWKAVSAGVPQGYFLGPLLFLIYINGLCSNIKIYANDTSIFSVVKNP